MCLAVLPLCSPPSRSLRRLLSPTNYCAGFVLMKRKTQSEPDQSETFARRLREQSRKITGPRRAILALLERQAHPLAIREIHKRLARVRCDLATVYRSIRMLEEME